MFINKLKKRLQDRTNLIIWLRFDLFVIITSWTWMIELTPLDLIWPIVDPTIRKVHFYLSIESQMFIKNTFRPFLVQGSKDRIFEKSEFGNGSSNQQVNNIPWKMGIIEGLNVGFIFQWNRYTVDDLSTPSRFSVDYEVRPDIVFFMW